MGDNERRRRRLRHPASRPVPEPPPTEEPVPSAVTAEVHDPTPDEMPPAQRRPEPTEAQRRPEPTEARPPRRTGLPPSEEREAERGLRGLVGSGASQVGTTAAMRARDASRPSPEEEAEAMERVVVVRRNWIPREDLPRGGGRPRP
jgi:hypothetical protein